MCFRITPRYDTTSVQVTKEEFTEELENVYGVDSLDVFELLDLKEMEIVLCDMNSALVNLIPSFLVS